MRVSHPSSERPPKLLIVDDSAIVRRTIQRFVAQAQVEVVGTAPNGVDAVAKFKEFRPQLVTMDITMPQMDGIQCVEAILAIDSSVKILIISALADKATAIEAIMKGANGFLCKPFSERELNEAIKELIAFQK